MFWYPLWTDTKTGIGDIQGLWSHGAGNLAEVKDKKMKTISI